MSLTTISQAAADQALTARIVAGAWQETIANPAFGDTAFGRQVLEGTAPILMRFAYPVAVDNAAAYESAVIAGNLNPGGDPAVITDAAIVSSLQAHWPADPPATS
jgi:hypothetical protein